jgi:CHASE2 domain-containing sensor protein
VKVAQATDSKRFGEVRRRLTAFILRYLPGVLLLGVLLAHSLHYLEIAPLQRLEAVLYDARVRFFAQAPIDERIVIVDIDERSLAELGRWPWSRARLAELVERIFGGYGALLLGLDVILAEAGREFRSGFAAGAGDWPAARQCRLPGGAGGFAAEPGLRRSPRRRHSLAIR